jgi:D-glycero-alpha-D-manno-heptose-7-phosphate kinase
MKVPSNVALKVTIFSEAPSGASTGTSAAVAVALVGALDRLTRGHLTAHEVAYTRELEGSGPDCRKLQDLRATAEKSRDAVHAGDFVALGRAMIENIQAQERLHPDLVSRDARRVIEVAKGHGALGWKVNGAGGDGGALTILTGTLSHVKRAMIRDIETENPMFKNIPVYLSRSGLRTWDRPADSGEQWAVGSMQ